ncbi:uncharacterized protein alms1 [Polymixia lowei]
MDPEERSESFIAEVDVSQSIGQGLPLGDQSHPSSSQGCRPPRITTDDWELQQLGRTSLQLDFQNSRLSPALALLPSNSGVQQTYTEYSLFQQSDLEFAPLRASPDISVASERFHIPPQGRTSQASEHGSLSQHPLAQTTVLSEEGASSCCSLSQHSMSPGDEGRQREMAHSPAIPATVKGHGGTRCARDGTGSKESDADKPLGGAFEGDVSFLSGDISAGQLLELLQKDVGMPSGSSSAVSSASETSLKRAGSFGEESKSVGVSKQDMDQSRGRREGPRGSAAHSQPETLQLRGESHPGKPQPRLSDVANITIGSRKTQPDDASEALHRELLSEVERRSSCEGGTKEQPQGRPTPHHQYPSPNPTEASKQKPNMAKAILAGLSGTGLHFSAGYSVVRGHQERDLWSSGNQTGIDGSYLGFLPQSQSTPGVFSAPAKSSVKVPLGRLSAIESNTETSSQSSARISPQPAVAVPDFDATDPDARHPGTATPQQEEIASAKVQALPSLNYMQKVDAWRSNQSSGTTSLFDNLALQGFSGVSPKKKAYDAISDSLNRILSQQGKSVQELPASSATNQNVTPTSAAARSGSSSPRRGEAAGSAPTDKEDAGSAAGPSSSPLGRSQSHSSLSTVITSVQLAQQTERPAEREIGRTQGQALQQRSATAQPSALMSLGRFSDVSLDRDLSGTLSTSQDSYNSGQNLGASVGTSSVISLAVDNYAPYWNSKPLSPPPRSREFNIEERIPLYLHNLGIDQSPSTILTPFAPRGPIREPEFSPTDLCTIKGSIGTPTKSTQPSEGDSPYKVEFSRSSLLSLGSSMSIPLSVDSLCPTASLPEVTRASPPSDTAASQKSLKMALGSQPQESSHLPAPQQTDNSHSTIQLGDTFQSSSSFVTVTGYGDRNSEWNLQASHSAEQSTEDSFVGAKTLQEIRKLLGGAENIVSGGSSVVSSSSSAPSRLHSDDNILLSLRKRTGAFQDSFFTTSSSSAAGGSETRSSLLWARSSSDSVLTSERLRAISVGRESITSPRQPEYPSTRALSPPPAADTYARPKDGTADRGAGPSLLVSKSARRAEPEGCSAAPPDNAVPTQAPLVQPSPAPSSPQPASSPRDTASVSDEEAGSMRGGPAESSSPSPVLGYPEQEPMSDGSSESSLAARVAKLLQSGSPATVMSSTPSTVDQEESRAREWIKLKLLGQRCEPLELDVEDRKRIEEIKRELLLKHPIKSQGSTDTESSAVSSHGGPGGQPQPPPQPAETLPALGTAEDRLSRPSADPFDSGAPPHPPLLRHDLEARVREIAVKEGVTLPRANPRALTSITIATYRRSTSPSPSPSPVPPLSPASEPLRLAHLSTANGRLPHALDEEGSSSSTQATPREPVSVSGSHSSLYTREQDVLDSQSVTGSQGRRDAMGGQFDQPTPSSLSQEREDVKVVPQRGDLHDANTVFSRDNQGPGQLHLSSQYSSVSAVGRDQYSSVSAVGRDQYSSVSGVGRDQYSSVSVVGRDQYSSVSGVGRDQYSSVSGVGRDQYSSVSAVGRDQYSSVSVVGHGVEQSTGSSPVNPTTRPGHISHLHLTLSPKGPDHSLTSGVQARPPEFAPLRHSSAAPSGPDEELGLSGPLESHETREPMRTQGPQRVDTSVLFKTIVPEDMRTSAFPQSFTPPQRLAASPRPSAIQTPALPVLLPYKPHGSEELFYVPQTETQVSPNRSDSTVESSHPGSDDAVPPRFSSDVLGKQDPGLDRGVTIKHVEGIYSKRVKTASFKMQTPGHRGAVSVDVSSQTSVVRAPQPSSQISVAFTRVPLSSGLGPSGSRRDQGTSPVQFLSYNQSEESGEEFRPALVELNHRTARLQPNTRPVQTAASRAGVEREQGRRDPDQGVSTLDQLWRRFSERWGLEESRPTNEREASLLERLERLSRLIHGTAGPASLLEPDEGARRRSHAAEQEPRRRGEAAALHSRGRRENIEEMERSVEGEGGEMRRRAGRTPAAESTPDPAEEDSPASLSSGPSHGPALSRHLCQAERDESETTSTLSSAASTVDTARLIRAFGADRVRCLKTGSSLRKLYSAIDKQREGRERTRDGGETKDAPHVVAPSETTGTEDSIVTVDSASSTSSYSPPSHRGPSHRGSSHHGPSQSLAAKKVKLVNKGVQAGDLEIVSNGTRRHTRDVGTTFPSPGEARGPERERGRGGERSPSKTQRKRNQPKRYPQGVSWFVPAEHLRAEARKENQPEEEEEEEDWARRPSSAWFEPHSRTFPWREPLRQRQIQEDRDRRLRTIHAEPDPEPRGKTSSSGLARVSLQEALETRRPHFISQSRERLKRLALQVEERRLQADFSREREQLFYRTGRHGGPARPAGSALFRRAVPRKEMVQRSKQIYEKLPEVQRRREEERRKAEYHSYRLNAQLYNKRITNHVLGRRVPWQ